MANKIAKTLVEFVTGQLAGHVATRFDAAPVQTSEIVGLELTHNNDGGSFTYGSQVYTFSLTPTGKVKVANGIAFKYYGTVKDVASGIAGVGA